MNTDELGGKGGGAEICFWLTDLCLMCIPPSVLGHLLLFCHVPYLIRKHSSQCFFWFVGISRNLMPISHGRFNRQRVKFTRWPALPLSYAMKVVFGEDSEVPFPFATLVICSALRGARLHVVAMLCESGEGRYRPKLCRAARSPPLLLSLPCFQVTYGCFDLVDLEPGCSCPKISIHCV